jgi:flagellar secretion chaperone FliS
MTDAPNQQGNGLPMPTSTMLRSRYVSDSVETMSPARLLVALYDRLVLDLDRADAAIVTNDIAGAHNALVHAQDIVSELLNTLDFDAWAASAQLASVYEYVIEQLVMANVQKDAAIVAECREIIQPLRDAWRQAAGVVGVATPPITAA